MTFRKLTGLLLIAGLSLCLGNRILPAQTISGVINSYAKVLLIDTCENSLIIDNTSGFAAGDRVLLIQMKGATIDENDAPSFGTIKNMASAGDYEFTTIGSLSGLTVTLQYKISKKYDVASSVQLVKVPQYTDVTVNGLLTAKKWDGSSGGILVLEASGTLTLQAKVDVSGLGFRGGDWGKPDANPGQLSYFSALGKGFGAIKGESISQSILNKECGRGAQANGGGGGNNQNAGGGGGANGGSGGKGGFQTSATSQSLDIGGLGGFALDYSANVQRLLLGGGGGSGHNNDSAASKGANGGGIILIRADSIEEGNQAIIANGLDADTAGVDGAGGGGGGGSIVISARVVTGSVSLIAKGGNGGNNDASKIGGAQDWCYAPGGGAGGGRIFVNSATAPVADVTAGKAGIVTFAPLSCFGTTYGATDGTNGVINTGFVPFDSKILFTYPRAISNLDTVCEGDTITIGINGGKEFTWTPSTSIVDPTSGTPKVFPSVTTRYRADYKDDRGCPHYDTVLVIVNPHPQVAITGPDSICAGEIAKYVATSGTAFPNVSYSWTATDGTIVGTQNIDTLYVQWGYTSSGSITVSATPQGSPCDATITMPIKINTGIRPEIAGAGAICEGDTLTLTASSPGATGVVKYLWSTGETSQSIRVDTAGKYFVLGTAVGECTLSSDTIDVIVHPKLTPIITPWLTLLPDSAGFDSLFVGGGYKTYDWSTGQKGDTLVIFDSGTYFCTVTDSNGCVGIASIYIPRDSLTVYVDIGTDTIYANPGDIVNFPVRLIRSRHLPPSGATQWVTTFTFNRTLLAPKENLYPSQTIGRWRTLTFNGFRPDLMEVGEMLPVNYIVALGDTTETPIYVETFDFTNGRKTYVTKYNGLLRIKVCTSGGTRLYSDSGQLLLSQNRPNPASDITMIDVDLREEGHTELIVCDMLGRKVRTIINGDYKIGHLQFNVDVSDLPRGKYVYVLQTPSAVRSKILQIER